MKFLPRMLSSGSIKDSHFDEIYELEYLPQPLTCDYCSIELCNTCTFSDPTRVHKWPECQENYVEDYVHKHRSLFLRRIPVFRKIYENRLRKSAWRKIEYRKHCSCLNLFSKNKINAVSHQTY